MTTWQQLYNQSGTIGRKTSVLPGSPFVVKPQNSSSATLFNVQDRFKVDSEEVELLNDPSSQLFFADVTDADARVNTTSIFCPVDVGILETQNVSCVDITCDNPQAQTIDVKTLDAVKLSAFNIITPDMNAPASSTEYVRVDGVDVVGFGSGLLKPLQFDILSSDATITCQNVSVYSPGTLFAETVFTSNLNFFSVAAGGELSSFSVDTNQFNASNVTNANLISDRITTKDVQCGTVTGTNYTFGSGVVNSLQISSPSRFGTLQNVYGITSPSLRADIITTVENGANTINAYASKCKRFGNGSGVLSAQGLDCSQATIGTFVQPWSEVNAQNLVCETLVTKKLSADFIETNLMSFNPIPFVIDQSTVFAVFSSSIDDHVFGRITGISPVQAYLSPLYITSLALWTAKIASELVDAAQFSVSAGLNAAQIASEIIVFNIAYAESYGSLTGGVNYTSNGADFAEYMPCDEEVRPAQIVGVRNGRVSLNVENADTVSVYSSNPVLLGNENTSGDCVPVVFIGHTDVICYSVKIGDYVVAAGNGMGIGRAYTDLTSDDAFLCVGKCVSIVATAGDFTLARILYGVRDHRIRRAMYNQK